MRVGAYLHKSTDHVPSSYLKFPISASYLSLPTHRTIFSFFTRNQFATLRQQTQVGDSMASFFKKPDHAATEDQDLSTILTVEERVELTLLIANIKEVMRKQINDNFDASIISAKPPQQALNVTDKNPNVDESKLKEDTEEERKAQQLREQREKELSAPKMLELKKDYLNFFDTWGESVLLRVGSVVNNPKEVTEEQKEKASAKNTPTSEVSSQPQVISKFSLF